MPYIIAASGAFLFWRKNKMKKIISLVFALFVLAASLTLVSCGDGKSIADKVAAGETVKIGVIQLMPNPSLDNCRKGILEALAESGIKYELKVETGSPNSYESDCTAFAGSMVADGFDMIIAIATPAAKYAFTAAADTNIPVIFCAVSDPVAAGLVKSMDKPGENCTGTSDVLDFTLHVNMIKAFQPDVKTIGVIYTTSEENSLTQLKNLRAVCDAAGIAVETASVQGASDVPAAAAAVAAKSDCILNFTDNNVVQNLSAVLSAAENAKIPVYGSEEEQVKNGCAASMSIDYVALGKLTGGLAVKVMRGTPAEELAVEKLSEALPVINEAALGAVGISVPAEYAGATRVG